MSLESFTNKEREPKRKSVLTGSLKYKLLSLLLLLGPIKGEVLAQVNQGFDKIEQSMEKDSASMESVSEKSILFDENNGPKPGNETVMIESDASGKVLIEWINEGKGYKVYLDSQLVDEIFDHSSVMSLPDYMHFFSQDVGATDTISSEQLSNSKRVSFVDIYTQLEKTSKEGSNEDLSIKIIIPDNLADQISNNGEEGNKSFDDIDQENKDSVKNYLLALVKK